MLEEDASVFKLIGPVLVKQELMEVKNNVTKRVEFIKNDMCAPICNVICTAEGPAEAHNAPLAEEH